MSAPSQPRRLRKMLYFFVSAVVVLYVLICVGIYVFQDKMIFPGSMTQGQPDARVAEDATTKLIRLKLGDGTPIVARFGPAIDPPADRVSILFFYGNGMCMAHAEGFVDLGRGVGADVLMPDYPGYGMSGGKPSEAGVYESADKAYDHLIASGAVPERIIAVGWSLGGAVAIDLASRRPVGGLATVSTFTTMPAMARLTAPYAPTSLLLKAKFDSLSKIAAVKVPTLIVHGRDDAMIPPAMADELAAAAGRKPTLLMIDHADHNNLYGVGYEQVRAALGQLVDDVRRR